MDRLLFFLLFLFPFCRFVLTFVLRDDKIFSALLLLPCKIPRLENNEISWLNKATASSIVFSVSSSILFDGPLNIFSRRRTVFKTLLPNPFCEFSSRVSTFSGKGGLNPSWISIMVQMLLVCYAEFCCTIESEKVVGSFD